MARVVVLETVLPELWPAVVGEWHIPHVQCCVFCLLNLGVSRQIRYKTQAVVWFIKQQILFVIDFDPLRLDYQ